MRIWPRQAMLAGLGILFLQPMAQGWTQPGLETQVDAALLDRDIATLVKLVATLENPDAFNLGRTPLLHHAAINGDADMVHALLEAGLDANVRGPGGDTALTLAVELNRPDVVDLLLERQANRSLTNRQGLTASEIAWRRGDYALALRLLQFAARTPVANAWLLEAAGRGDMEAMGLALSAGAGLDARTPAGATVLQVSLTSQQWPVVEFLLNLSRLQRSETINKDDPRNLLEYALLQPADSAERRFAARVMGALLEAEILSPQDLSDALQTRTAGEPLRQLMEYIGLSPNHLETHFPLAHANLPAFEFSLPSRAPLGGATAEHWKDVQRRLAAEGLYAGPIDGIPGQGTFDAIYAYVVPLIAVAARRGDAAGVTARNRARAGMGRSTFLGQDGVEFPVFGQRYQRDGRYLPTGYVRYERAGEDYASKGYITGRPGYDLSRTRRQDYGFFLVRCDDDGNLVALRFTVLGQLITANADVGALFHSGDGIKKFEIVGGETRHRC